MNITTPQLPTTPSIIGDFFSAAQECLYDETSLTNVKLLDEHLNKCDLSKLEVRSGIFENCVLGYCIFETTTFVDVLFSSCDFSNANFSGAFFERCHFFSCKFMGADISSALLRNVVFKDCNMCFSSLDECKLTDVLFSGTDFTEASMSQAKIKRLFLSKSIFIKNNFFKTSLSGVDFTTCEFLSPIVSYPPLELKGITINSFQASNLIGLLGIKVK
ncbi:MAG: pentapeptide repeat-containing protein [Oscillospiraceae bacterium]